MEEGHRQGREEDKRRGAGGEWRSIAGEGPGASGNSSALSQSTPRQQRALGCSFSSPLSSLLSRTKLIYPKDLYTSRFQIETNAKILIGVMTMANVIFYEMFGKTQKGIIVCHMKFKRWLHPFVCRFAKVLFYENRNGVRKYQTTQKPTSNMLTHLKELEGDRKISICLQKVKHTKQEQNTVFFCI